MNAKEYGNYQAAVKRFLESNDVKGGCHGPKEDQAEPYFSWSPCGCCGSGLGGNREDYVFATESGDTFEESICVDCVYYLAYGQLDDLTMQEIEQGQ